MGNINFKPRTIFCRDNLDVLRGINSACIDLIYLDPPFNKNKVFAAAAGSGAQGAAFSDIFRAADIKDEWIADIARENAALYSYLRAVAGFGGEYNYSYLVYMAIRLIECRRALKETGSVYLHCDATMSHYLKIVMDCIFGERNFRNEIVWGYEKPRSSKKVFRRNHDILFLYTRGRDYTFHAQRVPTLDGRFEMRKPFKRPDGSVWTPQQPGKQAGSWWYDIPSFATRMSAKERTGYPTQKPLALLERIVSASSNEGDMVLDPFCGCATTCIAAEKLGRQWAGVDISKKTHALAKIRIKREVQKPLIDKSPHFTTKAPKRDKGA